LPIAIIVFICGEVLMTPCFDETAKKHSDPAGMATCLGLLHLVDGLGRMLGAAFALVAYGWMRHSAYEHFYWPGVVGIFLVVCVAIHLVAHGLARRDASGVCSEGSRFSIEQERAVVLAGPEVEP